MILRSGWQMVLTDLSLILFMITLSAMSDQPAEPVALVNPLPAEGEPIAIWRSGAQPVREWLADQPADPRLRATVVVRYKVNDSEQAAQQALSLAGQIDRPRTRIMLEPAEASSTTVVLTYDDAESGWHDACDADANGLQPGSKGSEPCA